MIVPQALSPKLLKKKKNNETRNLTERLAN